MVSGSSYVCLSIGPTTPLAAEAPCDGTINVAAARVEAPSTTSRMLRMLRTCPWSRVLLGIAPPSSKDLQIVAHLNGFARTDGGQRREEAGGGHPTDVVKWALAVHRM